MIKQSNFFKNLEVKSKTSHGGTASIGKRKERRPLDTKKPLHLVLRSSKAVGTLNFLRAENKIRIEKIIQKQARKFGVKVAAFANVGNHCHLLLRFTHRRTFQAFLISVTALIARAITKACKGRSFGKFWDALAFSRVITSNKELAIANKYMMANQIEAKYGKVAREKFLRTLAPWELKLFNLDKLKP